jgi:hypothetical protein
MVLLVVEGCNYGTVEPWSFVLCCGIEFVVAQPHVSHVDVVIAHGIFFPIRRNPAIGVQRFVHVYPPCVSIYCLGTKIGPFAGKTSAVTRASKANNLVIPSLCYGLAHFHAHSGSFPCLG